MKRIVDLNNGKVTLTNQEEIADLEPFTSGPWEVVDAALDKSMASALFQKTMVDAADAAINMQMGKAMAAAYNAQLAPGSINEV